ncbi:BnaCnng34120D [Brassica napus]|uniref:BnaCnng34120D protein n=1 Tax=Brassica napus TaxID=3708 RepID=A0A078J6V7_BRANA|nr:BnaCnng34120D [Brassica napus]
MFRKEFGGYLPCILNLQNSWLPSTSSRCL